MIKCWNSSIEDHLYIVLLRNEEYSIIESTHYNTNFIEHTKYSFILTISLFLQTTYHQATLWFFLLKKNQMTTLKSGS